MKIVIATGIFPPEIGGPALYSRRLAEELSKHGMQVIVFTYGRNISKSDKYRIFSVSRLWPYGLRQLIYCLRLILNLSKVDSILALDTLGAGLPAVLVGKLFGKKVAIRMGGDFLWEKYIESGLGMVTMAEFYKKNLQTNYPVLFRLIKFVLRNSDTIIFTTQFQKDIFIPNYGLDLNRAIVISNVFEKETIGNADSDEKHKIIIWAGRFLKLKNLEFLLKVFKRLSDQNSDLYLKLIGNGPELNKLKRESKNLKVDGRILFSNQLSEEMLSDEIRKSYFCVLPSLSEVSPNFALKCLGLNKSILVTQETGMKDEFPSLMYFDPKNEESLYQMMLRLLDENTYDNYQKFISNIRPGKNWDYLAIEYLKLLK